MIQKAKRAVKASLHSLYNLVLFLSTRHHPSKGKSLLIVKTDEIGDYVLWRNVAGYFKSSERFKDYSITLCGNQLWKPLTEAFDKHHFDHTIWLDKPKFKSNLFYRYLFLKKINQTKYGIVINPVFSRSLRIDDAIVIAARASQVIGMVSNENNVWPIERGYDQALYTELIKLSTDNYFDLYRNRDFAERVAQTGPVHVTWGFDRETLERYPGLPEKYFVITPGSGHPTKFWNAANFVAVANYLRTMHSGIVVLAGSKTDKPFCDRFKEIYPEKVIDLSGKASLPEFLRVLRFAQCLVSVDTGSVHLAASVKCPVFAVFNGSTHKRFAPYPIEIFNNFHAIYPDEVDIDLDDPVSHHKYRFAVSLDYNKVKAQKVIDAIKRSGLECFQL